MTKTHVSLTWSIAVGICIVGILLIVGFHKESQKPSRIRKSAKSLATLGLGVNPVATSALSPSPTPATAFKLSDPSSWSPQLTQAFTTLVALFVSIITNLAVGAWAVYKYRDGKKEKKRADLAETSLKQFREELRERLGYEIGSVEVLVDITNLNGDCDTRWIWKGIKKVRDDAAFDRVPGRMRFSTLGCSFSYLPTLLPGYTGRYEIEFLNTDIRSCEFNVKVKKVTDEIGYEYSAGINKAFCMTEEEITDQTYKYEWFGFHIYTAIETLTIGLFFPKHYQPHDIQHDVCIGWGPVGGPLYLSDTTEIERIRKSHGFKEKVGEASVTVSKPKIGYFYFLRWTPLPKEASDWMKKRGNT